MRGRIIGLLGLLALTGCASTSGGSAHIYSPSAVDEPPQLRACTGYEPPTSWPSPRARVTVRYDVTSSGDVTNAIVVRMNYLARQGGLSGHAIRVARSCKYTPAVLAGEYVAVGGLEKRFVFTVASR